MVSGMTCCACWLDVLVLLFRLIFPRSVALFLFLFFLPCVVLVERKKGSVVAVKRNVPVNRNGSA